MERESAIIPEIPDISIICGATLAPITPASNPKFAVRPSLKPYTTFLNKPPDSERCQGSSCVPFISINFPACWAESFASLNAIDLVDLSSEELYNPIYDLTSAASSFIRAFAKIQGPNLPDAHAINRALSEFLTPETSMFLLSIISFHIAICLSSTPANFK